MAGNIFLTSLSICLLILFNGCLAERPQRETQRCKQNQCQINRLEALEPENRIEAEAGMTEVWNNTNRQFQCAGVAFIRRTLERDALLLPSFTNAPQLVYIERGRGYFSAVFPGCPETFQESQEGGEFEQGEGGSFQDEHQKIRHFRNGDIIALPAGVTYWFYNTGDEPLVFVSLLDTSNVANQLDRNPRKFFLGGNPEQEFEQGQRGGSRERQPQRGEKSQCNNLFCGFDEEMLAEAFNVEPELIRRLQNEEDNRGNIVKVEGGLQVTQPPRQWEREQGESEGRRPWYERPGQSRPWYERPGQSRPWYERPGQSRPWYDRPGQSRPSYDRPGQSRPSYDRPGQSRPSYDRPGQSRPSYDRPGHEGGRPGFERPGHEGGRPGFERPGHEGGRPGFERPGHEGGRPGYERPGHEGGRPGYERPGHEGGRPGYERPGHGGGRPGYERPGHEGGRPGYERPGHEGGRPWYERPGHEGGRPWYERPGQKGERKPECKRRCEQECGRDNGLEETFCSMRLRENIGDPSRADVFTPRAGRVSTINSHNLPVLNWLQLSAEHGVLYRNAVFVPHWNLNAHSIMYATRGRARIQVVDHRGNSVFDDEIEQGQVLTIPQNFAVMKRAGDEGFEWVSFKTNNNAMINPLAGRTSAIRGLPGDVLRNAFQDLSDEDVQMLKNNRRETTLLSPSGSYERRISAE